MLRMISVSGIAIAMVIGFVVLSKQMRDDFDVRKKVYEGALYMKRIANAQLQCAQSDLAQKLVTETQHGNDADESLSVTQAEEEGNSNYEAINDTPEIDAVVANKPEIFTAVSSEPAGENIINVIAVFNNVSGQSGKLRIKAGRKLGLKCVCVENNIECNTVFSDINKKYIPGTPQKQQNTSP